MEEKMSDQDYQRGEKKQNCCRFYETRDKDMTEFYIIRVGGDKNVAPNRKNRQKPTGLQILQPMRKNQQERKRTVPQLQAQKFQRDG
jgi:hypothetical protein